jgi:hypothetical protein
MTMAAPGSKQILVTYSDRKKVLNIPPEGDIDFLTKEFFRIFEINSAKRVVFQRFNSTFQEYVDLENGNEICDKDKLQAVFAKTDKVL